MGKTSMEAERKCEKFLMDGRHGGYSDYGGYSGYDEYNNAPPRRGEYRSRYNPDHYYGGNSESAPPTVQAGGKRRKSKKSRK